MNSTVYCITRKFLECQRAKKTLFSPENDVGFVQHLVLLLGPAGFRRTLVPKKGLDEGVLKFNST